ncbi:hypothetical protein GJ744_005402 [Endocarpon pusillum]|uniref:SnoaL-like domain-containing protein n=1 Tax=Endocarpon pusillum TaxID=364733 RepID=A0A8H7DZM3_9EURO|nr:hypothetical protein GJ744_005402 [Endocarpon pusillum]
MKSLLSFALSTTLILRNTAVSSAASPQKCTPAPAPETPPDPLPVFDLVEYYYEPPSRQSPPELLSTQVSESQIRNKLALNSLALDGEDFDGLDYIFTKDAVVNLSAPIGVVKGRDNIKQAIRQVLTMGEGVDGHDLISSPLIEVDPQNPCSAKSLTYFTTTFFGVSGPLQGLVSTLNGEFRDIWVQDEAGEWRISIRILVYIGYPIGNLLPQ